MDIDPFKIQSKIDVHKIKSSLWRYMLPRLANDAEDDPEEAANPAAKGPDPDQDASSPNQEPQKNSNKSLQMSEILCEMYGSGTIDSRNVTVNSAFICMLHLANEEGLKFVGENETDFRVILEPE